MSQTPEVPGNAQGNEGVAPNATEGVDPLTSAPSAPAATASEGSGPLDTSVTAIQQKPPDEPTPSASATLQQQIKSLTALQGRVAKLRGLPAQLLAFHLHPQSSGLTLDMGVSTLGVDTIDSLLSSTVGVPLTKSQAAGVQSRNAFRALTDTRTELLSEASQKALKVARESEASDKSDILAHGRRERKRRRPPTAESPAPFPSFQTHTTNVFPRAQKDKKLFSQDELLGYIRDYNSSKADGITKIHVWTQSRREKGGSRRHVDPITLRVTIRDVTKIFVKMTFSGAEHEPLVVESAVALGPREKRSPHSYSDFMVYQKLTQQIARMVEREPDATLPQLMDLLTSYESLFVDRCSVCERVLSQEGHVPPVGRVWIANPKGGEHGTWDARHVSCLYA